MKLRTLCLISECIWNSALVLWHQTIYWQYYWLAKCFNKVTSCKGRYLKQCSPIYYVMYWVLFVLWSHMIRHVNMVRSLTRRFNVLKRSHLVVKFNLSLDNKNNKSVDGYPRRIPTPNGIASWIVLVLWIAQR